MITLLNVGIFVILIQTQVLRMHKVLLIFLFFMLSLTSGAFSQPEIFVNDTIITRGTVSNIPVYLNYNGAKPSNITIYFSYNAYFLSVYSANGGSEYRMNCQSPAFQNDSTDLQHSVISISCGDINDADDGIMCILRLEALASPDTASFLTPDSVFFNGIKQNDAVLRAGLIKSIGSSVIQQYNEGIGHNEPNEFKEHTAFPIIINKNTKVEFAIYTVDGRRIVDNSTLNSLSFTLYKKTTSGYVKVDAIDGEIERGEYRLDFFPNSYEFSTGAYFIQMITASGAYSRSFMICK